MRTYIKHFIVVSGICLWATGARAEKTRQEINQQILSDVQSVLDAAATEEHKKLPAFSQQVQGRARAWAEPTLKLPENSYSDEFAKWIVLSTKEEAAGLGLFFLQSDDPTRKAFESTTKRLSRVYATLTRSKADALLQKRDQNLVQVREFSKALESDLLTKLRALDVVRVEVSGHSETSIFNEATPFFARLPGTVTKIQDAVIEPSGSAFVQSYVQMLIRDRIAKANRVNWYSVFSIASPFYDETDKRFRQPIKSFEQVRPKYAAAMSRVLEQDGPVNVIHLDGLNMFIWDSYQSMWLEFRKFEPEKANRIKMRIKFDPDLLKKLEVGIDGFRFPSDN